MRKFSVLLFLIFIIAVGCSKTNGPTDIVKIDIEEIIKSPTILQIDSTSFSLSVYLWRDYMPIAPDEGRPMQAVVIISTSDSSNFPKNINADKLWVIDSTEVWETDIIDDIATDPLFQIAKRASNGPLWATGISVDAVVRIVQNDSIYYYLKVENILINRTD